MTEQRVGVGEREREREVERESFPTVTIHIPLPSYYNFFFVDCRKRLFRLNGRSMK